jgi:hypothetical protein
MARRNSADKRSQTKHPQSIVNKALSQLSDDDTREWNKLIRFNANYPDLQTWLAERGHQVSIQNLSSWWTSNRPRGNVAIAINNLSEQYLGADAPGLLQMSVCLAAQLLDRLQELLADDLAEATTESKLTNVVSLLRELRQASSELHKLETVGDRNALLMAGAFQLAEELKTIFKGSPFEQALETGIHAALTKIND